MSGSTSATSAHVVWSAFCPSDPSTSQPPARRICSGTQCPTANGGSSHSTATTRTGGRPASRRRVTRCSTAPSRSRSDSTRSIAASSTSVIAPTVVIVWKIPSSEVGLERDDRDIRVDATSDLVHLAVADGADVAQLLGQDQVGLDRRERLLIELIQRRAAVHRGRDAVVDVARRRVGAGR